MRWDRENELDLADVGGEANATTHGGEHNLAEAQTQATGQG
jgi:hypothetical protein